MEKIIQEKIAQLVEPTDPLMEVSKKSNDSITHPLKGN
jgi:hypothetical protein